jgi:hypothetical protein
VHQEVPLSLPVRRLVAVLPVCLGHWLGQGWACQQTLITTNAGIDFLLHLC